MLLNYVDYDPSQIIQLALGLCAIPDNTDCFVLSDHKVPECYGKYDIASFRQRTVRSKTTAIRFNSID